MSSQFIAHHMFLNFFGDFILMSSYNALPILDLAYKCHLWKNTLIPSKLNYLLNEILTEVFIA